MRLNRLLIFRLEMIGSRQPLKPARGTLIVMRRFIAQGSNESFACVHCHKPVPALANGSYRNHCPHCLYSLHVDINPGDRANACRGILEPVAVDYNAKKGWIIVSRCQTCGELRRNKAALDDPNAPDNYDVLLALSQRPHT